ncbi:helix-turn-helix transcriptional regulator [Bacillus thuringiensis]|uniref:helix-turn-helix transcriptional regulator n=1 Tax=Bacillus thuringiensis TaxID=1428 RepID=UPI002DBCF45E|nr:helix-turn-helix transcriptional regulator [Bacillus thuringiensis]MEC3159319.1 helix-turn-helix transcriptional regulator [Bacillus thuringiensis]
MGKFNGQKLKEIRLLFGLYNEDVADLLGISFHKEFEMEQSRMSPNFEQLQILCKKFYVKPKYFYSKSELPDVVDESSMSLR